MSGGRVTVGRRRVDLTHPDKVLYPDDELTKAELVEHYRRVADLLLPHMGTWTHETQEWMEQWTINNVKMAITEGKLHSRVPEQKDQPY